MTYGRTPTRQTSHQQAAASVTASTSSPSFSQNVFESILNKGKTDTTTSPKGDKKRKQEGLEEGFMASQSSEATTPDKREKKMPAVKRRLSFHDDDRPEETTTQEKSAKITILPAGQRIVNEKKRKKQIEQNRTSEDEVEQHAPVGLFDSLLDSLTVEEGTPEKNDDRTSFPAPHASATNTGPSSSSSKKKPKKPEKAVDEDESCSGGIHLDPVSRFLYVDAFFVFYNLGQLLF